jgi:hypothetical protein
VGEHSLKTFAGAKKTGKSAQAFSREVTEGGPLHCLRLILCAWAENLSIIGRHEAVSVYPTQIGPLAAIHNSISGCIPSVHRLYAFRFQSSTVGLRQGLLLEEQLYFDNGGLSGQPDRLLFSMPLRLISWRRPLAP